MVVCQERATEEIELKVHPCHVTVFSAEKNSGPALLVGRESRNCHSFSDLLVKRFAIGEQSSYLSENFV